MYSIYVLSTVTLSLLLSKVFIDLFALLLTTERLPLCSLVCRSYRVLTISRGNMEWHESCRRKVSPYLNLFSCMFINNFAPSSFTLLGVGVVPLRGVIFVSVVISRSCFAQEKRSGSCYPPVLRSGLHVR